MDFPVWENVTRPMRAEPLTPSSLVSMYMIRLFIIPLTRRGRCYSARHSNGWLTLSGVCAQNPGHESRCHEVSSERSVEPAGIVYCCFAKYFSNKSCDRCAPSSVSSTDFAFVAGSEMYPF